MRWENINITRQRLNGLKLCVAQIVPGTSPPKLLDHILEKAGIGNYTDEELQDELNELENISK
jgi:hypothetical protein